MLQQFHMVFGVYFAQEVLTGIFSPRGMVFREFHNDSAGFAFHGLRTWDLGLHVPGENSGLQDGMLFCHDEVELLGSGFSGLRGFRRLAVVCFDEHVPLR